MHDWTVALYSVNFVLLTLHQIDSAYWKEWELFRLPTGNQANLFANLLLIPPVLLGFALVLDGHSLGNIFALGLGAVGITGAAVPHAIFLARGDQRFRQPASLMILAGVAVVSPAQIVVAIGQL